MNSCSFGLRPYYAENTGSHPNPEVKLHQARLVLGWGTTLEPRVLQAVCPFLILIGVVFYQYRHLSPPWLNVHVCLYSGLCIEHIL